MLAFLISIVAYVLGSLGYYTIAKRRGIHHAWLAWVPVGNMWLTGCISDHYQSFAKGKVKNKRTVLMVLSIIVTVCLVLVLVVAGVMFAQIISMESDYPQNDLPGVYDEDIFYDPAYDEELPEDLFGTVWCMIAAYFVLILVSLPMAVIRYIALYDVFASCDPNNSVLYLLLSIFLGIEAFLVFACREKDALMPPPVPPMYTGYQMSYGQPPAYPGAPQSPEIDPWERKEE